jgi:hypothetical protein
MVPKVSGCYLGLARQSSDDASVDIGQRVRHGSAYFTAASDGWATDALGSLDFPSGQA